MNQQANRNHSLDAFRVIANWVIICVHTEPFMTPEFGPEVGGAYKATPIGLDLNFNTRDGAFFSSIFVFTGYLIHRCIFLLLLSSKRLGEFTLLTGLSKYSGGVYCAHMLFVRLLTVRQLIVGSVLWEIGRPFLILVLTYVFVMSAAKIRILKPVLT